MGKREDPIHLSILAFLRLNFPEHLIHHSPNEQQASAGDRRGAAIAMQKARKMGMVKGWPDLQLLLPDGPVFFEVKAEGSYLTAEQQDVLDHLRRCGYRAAVVRSIPEVQACLDAWGIPMRLRRLK